MAGSAGGAGGGAGDSIFIFCQRLARENDWLVTRRGRFVRLRFTRGRESKGLGEAYFDGGKSRPGRRSRPPCRPQRRLRPPPRPPRSKPPRPRSGLCSNGRCVCCTGGAGCAGASVRGDGPSSANGATADSAEAMGGAASTDGSADATIGGRRSKDFAALLRDWLRRPSGLFGWRRDVIVLLEMFQEIADVQEGVAIEADVHEGRLHSREGLV